MTATATAARAQRFTRSAALPLFTATIFLSAGLMFLVEPMVGKMVLPQLGGSPSVWSTCLLFFQAMLLLGYAYAHAIARLLPRRFQILLHCGLVLPLAVLTLPIAIGNQAPSATDWPALWLLTHLAATAGPAIFALSATAPLLQTWFAGSGHEAASDPYFLYAGSNAGSLLALLAYPLLVEPAFPLNQQALLWAYGFGALCAGLALTGASVFRHSARPAPRTTTLPARAARGERLLWTTLAFVPSSLLLGTTAHISTDIASAPLLWVVPLAIYLLTFILAFARKPPLPHALMVRAMPLLVIPVAITATPGLFIPAPVLLVLHLGSLFAVAMVCHGELAHRRPATDRLTEFYLFMSIGGVLGGIFNALLAPVLFPDLWEYPLALIAACLLKPSEPTGGPRRLLTDAALAAALLLALLAARWLLPSAQEGQHIPFRSALCGFVLPGLVLLNFSTRRLRFGLGVAACFLIAALAGTAGTLSTQRSFFGVYRVQAVSDATTRYLVMMHGTTMHGVRSLGAGDATLPMSYYDREGSFGHFFGALPPGADQRVAVIGLGIGNLACYARPGEAWTFYEIDPLVERLARDPATFQFMQNCGHPNVVLGDARLRIAAVPDGQYDLIVLDAFTSNSIPIHLITREAIALYTRKLSPHGRMILHISNRSLDLQPLVSALMADAGLAARIVAFNPPPAPTIWRHAPSELVAVAREAADLDTLKPADGWQPLPPADPAALWTDQRSDLLRVIRFRF